MFNHPLLDNVQCGVYVPPGWTSLVEVLAVAIQVEIDKLPYDTRSLYTVTQIKEKFGALRFYMSHATPEMCKILNYAEDESTTVCDVCGGEGQLRGTNEWLRTRCDKHV